MTPVDSLLYVCQTSQSALSKLTEQLRDTSDGDRTIPSLLSAIQREADVLSASLAKLAVNSVAEIPEARNDPPSGGDDLLDSAGRALALIKNGGDVCVQCGGVRRQVEDCLKTFKLQNR